MRRALNGLLTLSTALLVACGVSVEQPMMLTVNSAFEVSNDAVAQPAASMPLVVADPAQARAMLRSQKRPARQQKLWVEEEMVVDAVRHERVLAEHVSAEKQRIIGL